MKKYLHAILVFDVALPALFLGLPLIALLCTVLGFQGFVDLKSEELAGYQTESRQTAALGTELQPMRAKIPLLKALLSNDDIEAKLGSGIAAGLEKFSSDDIEQTLHDFQYGPSTIGPNFGEGRRLSLKLSSRWESLNIAAADWETRFPNLILESLSIDPKAGTAVSAPYLESAFSYFVVSEN